MTHFYSAFGSSLRSSIPLPELSPADPCDPKWTFEVVDRLPETEGLSLVGEEEIYGSVSARLFRHVGGHRIVLDDTGAYDLLNGARDILWLPTEDPWWDFGRAHLIGRVLATCLQLEGTTTLHASAVEMADGVVGFLAPKHFGKSTLAMMLYRAGARFVTDDSLAVDFSDGPLALPGVPSLRVRAGDEGAARLVGEVATELAGRDGKVFLPPFPADRLLRGPARISSLYLLGPRAPEPGQQPAVRTRLEGAVSAISLLSQMKIGTMLGPSFAGTLMNAAAVTASTVPIYELGVVRDLDRLPEVIDRLIEWHGLK